ncbi:hypothetical protein [Plantactinospora sp. DSM 117369]
MTVYDELVTMTGGDQQAARVLLAGLRQLRDRAPDQEMRRFAREVLEEQVSLREVARSEAYACVLSRHFDHLTRWRDHVQDADPASEDRARGVRQDQR